MIKRWIKRIRDIKLGWAIYIILVIIAHFNIFYHKYAEILNGESGIFSLWFCILFTWAVAWAISSGFRPGRL